MKTLSLGQGFKTMENNPVMQTAVKIDETKIKKANEVKYKSARKLIQASHSTLQELSASLNLSTNVSNIAPELQIGFTKQLKSEGINSYLVLTFTQILSTESLVESTYSADTEAANLLTKSLPRFYEGHGNEFIKAISYGRELTAIIQLKDQTFVQTTKGDVKAGVKNTAVEASAEFHASLQEIDNSQIANIFYYVSGSKNPELTLAENIEELYQLTDLLKAKTAPKIEPTKKEKSTSTIETTTTDKEKTKAVDLDADPVQVDYESADYSEIFDSAAAHSLKRKSIANQNMLEKISECHQILISYNELIEYALNNGTLFKLTTHITEELETTHATIANYISQLKDMASDVTQTPFVENDVLRTRVNNLNTIVTEINTMQTSLVHLKNKEFLVAEFDADYSKIVSDKQHSHRNSHYQKMHMPPYTKNLRFEVFELDTNGQETIAEGVQFKLKEKQLVKDKTLYKKLESGVSVDPIKDKKVATVCITDLKKVANASTGENFIIRTYAKIGNSFPSISQLSLDRLQSLNKNPSELDYFSTAKKSEIEAENDNSLLGYIWGGIKFLSG